MARAPLVSSTMVLALALLGLRCAFLPGPSATAPPARGIAAPLQGAALASSALAAAAAPVLAEEIDGADAYNRKVFTGAAYALVLAAFLVGLIISQARKLVERSARRRCEGHSAGGQASGMTNGAAGGCGAPEQDAGGRPLLQIAPMMEVTHRDFRYFMRLLTRRAQLWTEMVVDDTLLHNLEPPKCDRFLGYHPEEHPVVCQLGGSDPGKLAQAAQVVERYGYDEVNLNVGCPSCRVAQKGEFGCSLMLRKEVVRDIVHSMSRAVQIPVTVKCRLGCDDHDSPEFTRQFVQTVAMGGCKHFVIHARKAWLTGLSPAQNRNIPPLHYPRILDLCREFPDLRFSLNGGVADVGHARALLGFPALQLPGEREELVASAWDWPSERGAMGPLPPNFQGVMIGRGAMNNPAMLWDVDRVIYGAEAAPKALTRRRLLDAYTDYLAETYPEGDGDRSVGSMHLATKPTLGLFSGLRGNKAFRVSMDNLMRVKGNKELGPAHVLAEAMKALEEANPGLLDEPLAPTLAYKPRKAQGTGGSVPCEASECPPGSRPQNVQKGKKRKNEREVDDAERLPPPACRGPSGELPHGEREAVAGPPVAALVGGCAA